MSSYDEDFDAWAIYQAAALRAVSEAVGHRTAPSADLLGGLDWANLAEEIEALAKKDRRELGSRLSVLVEHLTKLRFSTQASPRAGWIETVMREREEVAELLLDSPSLRREVPALLARRSGVAIERAGQALSSHGDMVGACAARLAAGCEPEEALGASIPGEPSV